MYDAIKSMPPGVRLLAVVLVLVCGLLTVVAKRQWDRDERPVFYFVAAVLVFILFIGVTTYFLDRRVTDGGGGDVVRLVVVDENDRPVDRASVWTDKAGVKTDAAGEAAVPAAWFGGGDEITATAGADSFESAPVRLKRASPTTQRVTLAAKKPGPDAAPAAGAGDVVRLVVVDADDRPVDGAALVWTDRAVVKSGAGGVVEIPAAWFGGAASVEATIWADSFDNTRVRILRSSPTPQRLRAGAKLPVVTLLVTGAGGKPVPFAAVRVVGAGPEGKTNLDGVAKLDLKTWPPPGEQLTLSVTADNYVPATVPARAIGGGVQTVALASRTLNIHVRAVDKTTRAPLAGVPVELMAVNRQVTNAQGAAEFVVPLATAPGTLIVRSDAGAYLAASQTVSRGAGDDALVTLELSPAGRPAVIVNPPGVGRTGTVVAPPPRRGP